MIAASEPQMVERRYQRPFAFSTSTSSQPEEPVQSPTTFGVAPDRTLFLIARAPRSSERAFAAPVRRGSLIFVESEEACYESLAECLISPQWIKPVYRSGLLASPWRSLCTARPTSAHDVMDWEYAVPAPKRPSGTIKVTLSFAGKGKPLPFNPD
jgi:hypothetical protein